MSSFRRRVHARRLRIEPLESRRVLSITVDTLVDENNGVGAGAGTSLREAIAAAASGETINFSVTGTIEVASTLTIDKTLSIAGPGANLLTIRAFDPTPATKNGDGVQIFKISDNIVTNRLENSISGLTLTGADTNFGGGAISTNENLVVSDCVLSKNRSGSAGTSFGGGGAIQSIVLDSIGHGFATSLTVRNSVLSGNSSTGEGGAIRKRYGTVLIEDCTITDNSARYGGGVSASDGGVAVQIDRTTISNNRATGINTSVGSGGGVFVKTGPLSITNSTITGNTTGSDGGGVWADFSVTMTDTVVSSNSTTGTGDGAGVCAFLKLSATRCTILNNSAAGNGGGVFASRSTLTDCTISSNSARSGGGILFTGGRGGTDPGIIVNRCTISDNTATASNGGGGGIAGPGLTISESTIRGNRGAQGAGIWAIGTSATPAIIDRSTIADNIATGSGGGVLFSFLKMTASTVSGNSAAQGGGLYGPNGSISNSTISGNTAMTKAGTLMASGAGAITIRSSTLTANTSPTTSPGAVWNGQFLSSIIAGNTNGDVANSALSLGYNVVGTTGTPWFAGPGDQTGVTNPMLGPLADNGGPTKTHRLLTGSPAIDAGDPAAVAGSAGVPVNDQRGVPFTRVFAQMDIGAVERQPVLPSAMGDYNQNGVVDQGDFLVWERQRGTSVRPYTGTDGTGDGLIDQRDYDLWRRHNGSTIAPEDMAKDGDDLQPARGPVVTTGTGGSRVAKQVVTSGTAAPLAVQPTRAISGVAPKTSAIGVARVAEAKVRDDALLAWLDSATGSGAVPLSGRHVAGDTVADGASGETGCVSRAEGVRVLVGRGV